MSQHVTEVQIIIRANNDSSYRRAVKDTLNYLSQDGKGIGRLREIIRQVDEMPTHQQQFKQSHDEIFHNTEQYSHPIGNAIPEDEK